MPEDQRKERWQQNAEQEQMRQQLIPEDQRKEGRLQNTEQEQMR
jgi:hypothetical protein